jgi:hypothetical protein
MPEAISSDRNSRSQGLNRPPVGSTASALASLAALGLTVD